MKDPYKTLGVSPSADDDEIKKAYRELAKKYHPDNYANTEFSDLANEKMQDINEAYDEILRRRATGDAGGENTYSAGETRFPRIRELIAAGRFQEAEILLDQEQIRPAEWYYLKGLCAMSRRNYNDASAHFGRAYRMEPNNGEYGAMYQRFRTAQQSYGTFSSDGQYRECSACDICSGLICADCLCECCGGDLIACC